jgi:single-stranded DNA-binding protein
MLIVSCFTRTLVYVEGDAAMRSYEDADGKRQSALSIVQRKPATLFMHLHVKRIHTNACREQGRSRSSNALTTPTLLILKLLPNNRLRGQVGTEEK